MRTDSSLDHAGGSSEQTPPPPQESWRTTAWQVTGIHGLIALTYWLWPKKAPAGTQAKEPVTAKENLRH